jgi:hypothetical protein
MNDDNHYIPRQYLPCLFGVCMAMALFLSGCGGTLSEKALDDEKQAMSEEDFVASIKQQIDDQVTYQSALDDIAKARGKVVKWSGDIVITWKDKLLIASPKREGGWNHFILVLDHPLPQASSVEDLIQTVSKGDAVYVVGRIIDRQTVVLETGSDLNIPHLKGYLISKENDRQFINPVWVGQKM